MKSQLRLLTSPLPKKSGDSYSKIVAAVADFFSADFDELLTNIINENKQLNAIMRVAQQLQTAA